MKKRNLLLSLATLATSMTLFAQPTSLPSTVPPTWDATNVVSVFCSAPGYVNIAGINYRPGWGQSTTVTQNDPLTGILKYGNFNYEGTEFPATSVTDMTNLHVDLWSATSFTTRIYPIIGGTGITTNDTQFYTITLTANDWTSVDIPLTTFATPLSSVFQFKFDLPTPVSPAPTFYIANWYFYNSSPIVDTNAPAAFTASASNIKVNSIDLLLNATDNSGAVQYTIKYGTTTLQIGGQSGVQRTITVSGLNANTPYTFTVTAKDRAGNATAPFTVNATTLPDPLAVPTVAAPAPKKLVADVISVWSSTYGNYAFNYGGWGQTTTHTTVSIAGKNTLKLANFNYQGFEFVGAVGGIIDASAMDSIHIDVWTPNETKARLFTQGLLPFTQGVWQSYDFLVSTLGITNLADVQTLGLYDGTGGTIYVDNLYFYKGIITGVNTLNDNGVRIFVANNKLNISGSKDAVVVYNSLGKVVYQNNTAENLSITLTNGLYIVKTGTTIKKILMP